MKKLLTIVLAGGMLAFYACGQSKAELEAKEKAKQDSIHAADSVAAAVAAVAAKEKATADSLAQVEAAKQKVAADSLAAVEASKTKGGKAKSVTEKKKESAKKAVEGRG